MTTEYVLDGSRIACLEDFYDEISEVVIPGQEWGRGLDAFNDILRGGFGTPSDGFTLRWSQSEKSRESLGYAETTRQIEIRLSRCHLDSMASEMRKLADARNQIGPTVFDWLVDIIRDHGPGGSQERDNVRLFLE